MWGIYISDGNDPRTSVDQVQSLIASVARQPPIQINITNQGFLVKFAHDLDCNIMFNPHIFHLFKRKRLSLFLSKFTQKNREVYILDPSDDILSTPEHSIINEIHNRYATSILQCNKIVSAKTQKKYIILTVEKKEDMTRLTSMGQITVFNQQFTAQQKREDNPNLNSHNVRQQPQPSGHQNQQSGPPGTSGLARLSNWGGHQQARNSYSQSTAPTQTVLSKQHNSHIQNRPVYLQTHGSQYSISSQPTVSSLNGPIYANLPSTQFRPGPQPLATATQGSIPPPLSTHSTASSFNGPSYGNLPQTQYGPISQAAAAASKGPIQSHVQVSGHHYSLPSQSNVSVNLPAPHIGPGPQTSDMFPRV